MMSSFTVNNLYPASESCYAKLISVSVNSSPIMMCVSLVLLSRRQRHVWHQLHVTYPTTCINLATRLTIAT